jgi:hypothetical protein
MEHKRIRKFQYETEYSDNVIIKLKNIECKYHIFGIDGDIIKGSICFINPRTPNKIKQKYFDNNVVFIDTNDEISIEEYKQLENVWEIGKLPTNGRPKIAISNATLVKPDMVTTQSSVIHEDTQISTIILNQHNELLQQNNSLLEHSKEMCTFLMKQNQQLLEENKQLKQTTSATNTTITNNIERVENKTINFNVFLNEECKNALTLNDFINSLKIEDADLFCAKEHGLVEAITNIFQRGLQNCDITERPVHCTDTKRETLHIKDQSGWIKESGADSKHMKNALSKISNKKIHKLSQYIRENPEGFNNVEAPNYEECLKMMRGVYGADEDIEKTEKKVIKNIAKSVYISGQISK